MNKSQPSISVVIPVYNRPALVMGTLRSVMAQSLQPRAVIVVDNGSNDDTVAAVQLAFRNWQSPAGQPVPELKLVSEPRRGAAIARNRGLEEVDTEWTMFFDSDDEMLPNHINRAMAVAEQNPDAEIVGWYVTYQGQDGRRSLKPFYSGDALFHNIFHGSMATLRYMARTELFRRVGGWDNNITVWDDIELGVRLIAQAPLIVKIAGLPTVLVHTYSDSISGLDFSSRLGQYDPALEALARNVPEKKKYWVSLKRMILAADICREGDPRYAAERARALSEVHNWRHRLLLKLIYFYRLHGGRGAARLFRPFL